MRTEASFRSSSASFVVNGPFMPNGSGGPDAENSPSTSDRERFSALIEALDMFQEQLVTSISPASMSCRAGGALPTTRTAPDVNSGWVVRKRAE